MSSRTRIKERAANQSLTPWEWQNLEKMRIEGARWVRSQNFQLFGTLVYVDGAQVSLHRAKKDAQCFFNKVDRALLPRKDVRENRRLPRVVFLERGRLTGENVHFHFFIKGNQHATAQAISETCERLWPTITQALDAQVTPIVNADWNFWTYPWKELDIRKHDTLMAECCHLEGINPSTHA